MTMEEMRQAFWDAIAGQEPGKEIVLMFLGSPCPVRVKMACVGGWGVEFIIAPGMKATLTRGASEVPVSISMEILPYEGLQ